MVSATDRRDGARVCAAAGCDCAGGLADLRPGPGPGWAWALAGLGAAVEEGPAMGEEEEAVDARACGSFAGTLSTSDVCVCGGEVAAVEVEVCGGD